MGMENLSNLNWLAILVAALAYFFLGAIWYSALFQKAWMKSANINMSDPNAKKGAAGIMITSFVLMFICCIGIALFLSKVGQLSWMSGLKTGLVAGLCFSATGISISYVYEKRPLALHLINGAYNTVGCIIAGIILAVWP